MAKAKHLTYEDRVCIEEMLNEHRSYREIARALGKSPSTIQREIKNHTKTTVTKDNDCTFAKSCTEKHICGRRDCNRLCKYCKYCKTKCPNYTKQYCQVKIDNHDLCNGCSHRHYMCSYDRDEYIAKTSHRQYKSTLTDARSGFDLTSGELIEINDIVSPRLKQGQSIYHILQSEDVSLNVSMSTIYRLVDLNELDARNIDLRNRVKIAKRKPRRMKCEMLSKLKIGHLYKDYLEYCKNNDFMLVEMDCVEGSRESKCVLLTLHFPLLHFQLAFIMSEHTSECVVRTLDMLETILGTELFRSVFQVILTDNGHEFMDVERMEKSALEDGNRTKVFFCEPNRSDQKGACENNHKYIRYVIPKGTNFDNLNQFQINDMMNHINSYRRKSLCGKSPYEIARTMLPDDFFVLLGIEQIEDKDIILDPSLFK